MQLLTIHGPEPVRMEPREVLARMSAREISDNIREFRRLDLQGLDQISLDTAVASVLSVPTEHGRISFLEFETAELPPGTRFYRARSSDREVPPESGQRVRDSEAPDGKYVKRQGRLHKVGESLLYTAIGRPEVPLQECRIAVGSTAVVFAFEARRRIKAPVIGSVVASPEYTQHECHKLNLLNDFLHDEFSREVEVGLEHLYRTSELIAKNWFDGPPSEQDCWVYSSTKDRNARCAAFRPNKAHECLKVVGAMLVERTGGRQFEVLAVGEPKGKRFVYSEPGSPVHRDLFPDHLGNTS